jgi:hypothetical protein
MILAALIPLLLLIVSFLAIAWVFLHYLDHLALGMSLWAVLALYRNNLPRDHRHLQWPLPPLALAWGLASLGALYWLRDRYLTLLADHAQAFDWLRQTVGYTMPDDIGKAVLPLSVLFLSLYVFAKGAYLAGLRLALARKRPARGRRALAYRRLPAQGWTLKPPWLYARWLARAVAVIGLAAFVVAWLVHMRWVGGDWVPLLAAALLLAGMESAAWLGGPLGGAWRRHLAGEDAAAELHGRFAAVWRSYRAIWPGKWLVAGNLAPRLHDGPEER